MELSRDGMRIALIVLKGKVMHITLVKRNRLTRVAISSVFIVGILANGNSMANAQMGPKEGEGFFGGALLGGVIGSFIGRGGADSVIGGIAGAAIGGFIGSQIGAALDEQDRLALARATQAAFSSGKAQRFSNRRTGVRGTVEVSSSNRDADGRLCRTVQQEVVKGDSVMHDTVTACRGEHGWKV